MKDLDLKITEIFTYPTDIEKMKSDVAKLFSDYQQSLIEKIEKEKDMEESDWEEGLNVGLDKAIQLIKENG